MKYWWLDLPYRLHVFLFTLFISPFVAFWHFFFNNFFIFKIPLAFFMLYCQEKFFSILLGKPFTDNFLETILIGYSLPSAICLLFWNVKVYLAIFNIFIPFKDFDD